MDSYHRRANARWAGSSFRMRAISRATASWSRGETSRSRRACCAQSLWSIKGALTGTLCHALEGRAVGVQGRALCQSAVREP